MSRNILAMVMRIAQESCGHLSLFSAVFLVFCLGVAGPAVAKMQHAATPDPILTGGAAGPCDPKLAGPDYVAGTDVNGNPVAPADLPGGTTVHLDSDTVLPEVPIHKGSHQQVLVKADVPGLADAVDPPPACPAPKARSRR
jgi:hypothetical protein